MGPSLRAFTVQALAFSALCERSEGVPSPRARAEALVAKMTLDEKIQLLHGNGWGGPGGYVGRVPGIPRLGIPDLNQNDGPQGYHCGGLARCPAGTTTAFPSGLNIAATWDPAAASAWGAAMGKEFYGKGANVQLGPGVCIARTPVGGRNFEYLSGEDPYLGSRLAFGAVRGIQDQGVIAVAKHYVLNNQETNRGGVSVGIDERTFMELYFPPFQGAVDAGVGAVMCSYNLINGTHACANNATLNRYLKGVGGFQGFVMTDWNGASQEAIEDGLDQEMPGNYWMDKPLRDKIRAGTVSNATLDSAVARVLTPLFQVGLMDKPNPNKDLNLNVSTAYSQTVARTVAEDSIVLVKNDKDMLPLDAKNIKSMLLVGPFSRDPPIGGSGSGSVAPSFHSQFWSVLAGRLGFRPMLSAKGDPDAQAKAKQADVVIAVAATWSGEGADRANVSYDSPIAHMPPQVQDEIMENISRVAGEKTVVLSFSPGTVIMPWADSVAAILMAWLPGQAGPEALANLLFGDVAPSAKLPVTIGNIDNEQKFTVEQFPGVLSDPKCTRRCMTNVTYSEGLFVGYRWYDKHGVTPKFPFGHGLAYTTFTYGGLASTSDPSTGGARVSVVVTNSGRRPGREVAQLYLAFPGNDPFEPKSILKGFNKTAVLLPGQAAHVEFALTPRDLSLWLGGQWVRQHGRFGIMVGSSSRDIRLRGTVDLRQVVGGAAILV